MKSTCTVKKLNNILVYMLYGQILHCKKAMTWKLFLSYILNFL